MLKKKKLVLLVREPYRYKVLIFITLVRAPTPRTQRRVDCVGGWRLALFMEP